MRIAVKGKVLARTPELGAKLFASKHHPSKRHQIWRMTQGKGKHAFHLFIFFKKRDLHSNTPDQFWALKGFFLPGPIWTQLQGAVDGRFGALLGRLGGAHAAGDVRQDVARGHGVDLLKVLSVLSGQQHGVGDQTGLGEAIGLSAPRLAVHLLNQSTQLLPGHILRAMPSSVLVQLHNISRLGVRPNFVASDCPHYFEERQAITWILSNRDTGSSCAAA